MLIQIHMLQNYVPSLLNRDDSGAAKSAPFGGRQRSRISSQCLKRSIRLSDSIQNAFKEDGLLADRTKRLPKLVAQALRDMGTEEEVCTAIAQLSAEIGQESTKRESKTVDLENLETRQLIFIGANEVKTIAEKLLALYNEDPKKWEKRKIEEITSVLGSSVPRSVDIAMFGRMTTSAAFEDIQASVQVAHALATNELVRVYDFFTAVDDLKKEDDSADAGAGMLGDVELNSSTYYKYFNIHWEGLVDNLGGDTEVAAKAVTAFVEAAALAQPSGKQNSTAALNLPDFVLIEVSDKNIPVNYANAFLKPAAPWANETLMQNAISKLDKYGQTLRTAYGLNGQRAYFSTETEADITDAHNVQSLPNLQTWVSNQIAEVVHAS